MKGPIQSVEITYFLHATEDAEKVWSAVARLIGVETVPEYEDVEGHYGNPIRKVRVHLTQDSAGAAFGSVVGKMSPTVRSEMASQLDSIVDEHSALFLRFDKQALVSGSLVLRTGDSVRIKVKPRAFLLKGSARHFYEGLLAGGH
ncbi:MAG: hypothetical protein HY297_00710 [Thaumarchaeota archaeon]|nr:hypothetical protein [Nitrososphaerota archaeon]